MSKQHYSILSHKNQNILYEGYYSSFKECLESAVEKQIALSYADLSKQNLSNATLDDAIMPAADFSGSNLSGANLSENCLTGSIFMNCALYNTCFAYSLLKGCDFTGASFGGTDITGCDISESIFSTLSCFSLSFTNVHLMDNCNFINPCGEHCTMNTPPIVIHGFDHSPIVFMDRHLKIKEQVKPLYKHIDNESPALEYNDRDES